MRTALLFILCTLLFLPVSAQENPFVFSHLKEEDGLSNSIVNCFLKDSRGILWVGTYNGFNRFDGSHFFVHKKRKGPNSMISEVVHGLCEDKKGNIWGTTDNGVFCYEPAEGRINNYPIKSFSTRASFFNIHCDKEGNIWTVGDCSLFKFNQRENKFEIVFKLTNSADSLYNFHVRKNGFQPDPSGKGFWMTTRSGLFYYDIGKNSLLDSRNMPGDSLFAKRNTSSLCVSPSGNLWFFNNDQRELICFDPATKKIIQRINIGNVVPKAEGATIFEDRNRRVWFSSWSYDMLVIDLKNGNKIEFLKHRKEDTRTIAGQFFWAAHQDDDGTIWLGTVSGISRCNPENAIYKEFFLASKINELKGTAIHMAEEDPSDKTFWMITRDFLLIHYDPTNETKEVYDLKRAKPNADGKMPGVSNIIRFFDDRVIIGTYTGAWQLKKGSKEITPYDYLPEGYSNFKCAEIAFDGDSILYFNSGRQILFWNRLTGKTGLISFPNDPSIPTDRTIISGLNFKPGQKIWVVSAGTHIAVRNNQFELTRLRIVADDPNENGVLLAIDLDKDGNVWLINRGVGLCRYEPGTQKLTVWDETDGLPVNRMHKLKVDQEGRIWSMVYNKVSVFIPDAGRFYNFKIPIGEDNLNYINHVTIRQNGNMIGTINNEIIEFFPGRIIAVPGKKKPLISSVSVPGKDFQLFQDTRLVLKPDENTVSFQFGLLTDKSIFPFDMEYMLEGAESKWTKATTSNEALYNNLAAGNYKFRVRANGMNNAWQTDEAVFIFTIKTPFYRSFWFLSVITLLTIGSIIFLYRYRLSQKEKMMILESKAQLLEKEKAMVMYESLKQQLNPHFLFNSLTSLSGLIETDQKVAGNFLEQMSGIYRYILKNGDNETVSLKDEIEFVQLYIDLQQTRFKKGLQVNINVPEEYHHYKIAPVTLQNMIENAIKHNIIDAASPLVIDIFIDGDYLVVKNNMQKKNTVETSNKKGLAHFISLYKYLSQQPVKIEDTGKQFQIKIPLI